MRPTDGEGPANDVMTVPPGARPGRGSKARDSSLLGTSIDTLVKSVGGVITLSLRVILEQDSLVRMGRGR
jgi:hypothetical protein